MLIESLEKYKIYTIYATIYAIYTIYASQFRRLLDFFLDFLKVNIIQGPFNHRPTIRMVVRLHFSAVWRTQLLELLNNDFGLRSDS